MTARSMRPISSFLVNRSVRLSSSSTSMWRYGATPTTGMSCFFFQHHNARVQDGFVPAEFVDNQTLDAVALIRL